MPKPTLNIALSFLFLLLTLISCKTVSYNGIYQAKSTGAYASAIQLNKDSTFKYGIFTDIIGGGTFTGSWKSTRDTLFLDVTNPVDLKNVIKEEKVNITTNPLIQSGYKEISIIAQDSIPCAFAKVYVDDIITPFGVDDNGRALIKKEKIDSVRIESYFMVPRRFVLSEGNSIVIKIYDYEFVPLLYRMVFTKWLFKKNYLIPIDGKGKLLERGAYTEVK